MSYIKETRKPRAIGRKLIWWGHYVIFMMSPTYLYYYVCMYARVAAQKYYGGHTEEPSLANSS